MRRLGVGDIEREGVQAIMFAPAGIAHRVGGSRRCHDRFTCIERRARDLASQPRLAPVTNQTLPIACSSLLQLSLVR
ncbi:hypothetical protein PUV44_18620 [Xanthomonas arboricola pv. corylina]|nr:hypothetical protein PUV44_18620 [Xanthomonas arboricola pv. corylina]